MMVTSAFVVVQPAKVISERVCWKTENNSISGNDGATWARNKRLAREEGR